MGVIIPQNEIDHVSVLSIEEYEKYKSSIPNCNHWWWLKSSGALKNNIVVVCPDGNTIDNGLGVRSDLGGVRPTVSLKTDNLKIGKEYIVVTADKNSVKCTAIDTDKVITNDIIGKTYYSSTLENDGYDTSLLKYYSDNFYDSII